MTIVRLEGKVGEDSEKRLYFHESSKLLQLLENDNIPRFYQFKSTRGLPKFVREQYNKEKREILFQGTIKEYLTLFGNNFTKYINVIREEINEFDSDKASPIICDIERASNSGYYKKINYKGCPQGYCHLGILVYSDDLTQDELDITFPKFTESRRDVKKIQKVLSTISSKSSKMLQWRSNYCFEAEINLLRKRFNSTKRFLDLLLIEG